MRIFISLLILLFSTTILSLSLYLNNPAILKQLPALAQMLLANLGTSLLSGLVVLFTFGFWEHRERLKKNRETELLYDLFSKDIIDTLKVQIFNSAWIIRKHFKIDIYLSAYDNDFIKFENHIMYSIQNVSNISRSYKILHSIDSILPQFPASFEDFSIDGNKMDISEIASMHEGAVVIRKDINLKANSIVAVSFKTKKILRKSEVFIWNTYDYVKGINLKISSDPMLNLEITGEVLGVDGKNFPKISHSTCSHEWDASEQVFLPYQGIQLRWFPCPCNPKTQ